MKVESGMRAYIPRNLYDVCKFNEVIGNIYDRENKAEQELKELEDDKQR